MLRQEVSVAAVDFSGGSGRGYSLAQVVAAVSSFCRQARSLWIDDVVARNEPH